MFHGAEVCWGEFCERCVSYGATIGWKQFWTGKPETTTLTTQHPEPAMESNPPPPPAPPGAPAPPRSPPAPAPAPAAPVGSTGPCMLAAKWIMRDAEAVKAAESAIGVIIRAAIDRKDPRKGSLTYCLSQSMADQQDKQQTLYFEETFADAESWTGHMTNNEGEALMMLFSGVPDGVDYSKQEAEEVAPIRKSWWAGISLPRDNQEIMALLKNQLKARDLDSLEGSVWSGNSVRLTKRWGHRLLPASRTTVRIVLTLEPVAGGRNELIQYLKRRLWPSGRSNDLGAMLLASVISDLWWYENDNQNGEKFSGQAIVVYLLFAGGSGGTTGADTAKNILLKSFLQSLADQVSNHTVVLTAENWQDDSLDEMTERLTDTGFDRIERRRIVVGYLMHPCNTYEWHDDPTASAETSVALPCDVTASMHTDLFSVRLHPTTGAPKALVFAPHARGRGTHVGMHVESGAGAGAGSLGNVSDIPLLTVLRRLAHLGIVDTEVPIGFIFGQLARLRSLRADIDLFNFHSRSHTPVDEQSVEADRLSRFGETLKNLGYAVPTQEDDDSDRVKRPAVGIEALDALIAALEDAYSDVVGRARAAVDSKVPIEYIGLMELFPIGALVSAEGFGGLGTTTAFRVIDAYYEPTLSVMGSRKYSFRLGLETLVGLAGRFTAVSFEYIFEEFTGSRDQSKLPLRILSASAKAELSHRAELLSGMGVGAGVDADTPQYKTYSAGSFFPHVSGRSRGAVSSSHKAASAGRIMIDTMRGLELGHAPVAAVDEVGIAVAAASKAFLRAFRASRDDESAEQRESRVQASGVRVWSQVPKGLESVVFPTVVGFSFSTKCWGHVLVDSLRPIEASSSAWEALVLPPASKDILVAMCGTAIGATRSNTLAFRDLVDDKGRGMLFLLYGPPGTGKTLSVESLALYFGRPLYSVSFAELGTTVAELEERLTDVLTLAAHWGAIVLLDEGDALVERRQSGALLLNSMTGVLLRLLESFEGAFFITTNRVEEFDAAALSRVTLAIRYDRLEETGRRQVWHSLLARVHAQHNANSDKDLESAKREVERLYDLDSLSASRPGGRNIGAVIRIALSVCAHRGVDFGPAVLRESLDVWESMTVV